MAAAIALGSLVLGGVAGLGCASETAAPAASEVVASEAREPLRAHEPSSTDPSGAASAGTVTSATATSGGQVVATLHTRDSDLTITGTGEGVRYSLLEADGTRRDGLTLTQLEAYDRNLAEVVKFAMAKSHTPSPAGEGKTQRGSRSKGSAPVSRASGRKASSSSRVEP